MNKYKLAIYLLLSYNIFLLTYASHKTNENKLQLKEIFLILMAITISASDWTNANVRKTLSWQAALTSKLRVYAVKVTFGSGDNYATGGVSVDLKQGKRVKTLVAVIPTYSTCLQEVRYDKANEKIQLYNVGGGAEAKFVEVTNTSSTCASKVFEFLVIGY